MENDRKNELKRVFLKNQAAFFLFFAVAFLYFGCSTNIESMFQDYNESFIPRTSEDFLKNLGPDDEGFDPDRMITAGMYYVGEEAVFTLSAPAKCTTYKWVFFYREKVLSAVDEKGSPWPDGLKYNIMVPREIKLKTKMDTDTFYLYMPDVSPRLNDSYRIELTVTGSDGTEYQDSCNLIIEPGYRVRW